ncbi:DUF4390 domain-containing protein [Bordetella petrii]|uniref:DUF4390 domain-containing protein n=1 Tax=Bordetella petrii TaxID=94624 RepID=UPI001E5010DE|nr:DUF4390 domain-containing protein [Bordetella petrii]MCD0505792.1 DUF4390 domain-containing protein [Bordetella petrii]
MISRLCCALLLVFLLLPLGSGGQALASEPRVTRIEPVIRDGKLEIDAEVDFALNDQLRDAAERGLPLYFTADLIISRSRWWWFDDTVVDTSLTWRVAYNALTRQWRAGAGELSLPVSSLDEAMNMVRHIRNWRLVDVSELDYGVSYSGQMRLRLDTSQLARPFQVNALNSSSWSLATPWSEFSFSLAEPRDPS